MHPYAVIATALIFTRIQVGAQSSFPLVTVPDVEASIDNTVPKAYVTTVGLVPTTPQSQFNAQTFINALNPYYVTDAGIPGMITITTNDITTNQVNADLLLVTYTVRYTLEIMRLSGVTNEQILNTIGNYDAIQTNVGSSSNTLARFYIFQSTPENFIFAGQAICGSSGVSCNGTQVTCAEDLNGVSVTCVSPCKLSYCMKNGTCAQTDINSAPTCTCLSTSDVWFLGERCEVTIQLWMVIVVAVGCLIIIILAIVFACCFYKKRRRIKEKEAELKGGPRPVGYANTSYLNNEKSGALTPITRNKTEIPKLQARPEPVAYNSPSSYNENRDGRRRRSDSRKRDRYDGSGNRTRSRRSTSSEESSDSFDDTDSHPETPDPASGYSSSSSIATTQANPHTGSTMSQEFGNPPASEVEMNTRDQGTSPIRWYPTSKSPPQASGDKLGKINIAERKGWQPSLGPQMFELQRALGQNGASTSTEHPYITDTDI